MKHFLAKGGKRITIGRNVTFYNPSMIEIGNDNYFAYGNWFVPGGRIKIGNRNLFGPYSVFVAGNHVFDGKSFFNELADNRDIIIGDDNWIGANSNILAGTVIKNRSVIGSGAILNKELPDQCKFIAKHENIITENKPGNNV
jgi:acetyltransferase-like isoleucine patch superfamily enzyme